MSEHEEQDLPQILVEPPGPHSRALAERLRRAEAPGINTLFADEPSLVWDEAFGSTVRDVDGNLFLDFTSGFGASMVGHRHPKIVEAIAGQSRKLIHGLGDVHSHRPRLELAERLGRILPIDEPTVYFAISGSDAVEIALKTALLATGRQAVLAFDPGYHGLTLGALAATSRPLFREPFVSRLHPHVIRLPFATAAERVAEAISARPDIGCILVEPIVGREGVLLPPAGWLKQLAEICRVAGVLLIADEILTGFGRTGDLFAVEHDGVRPDLVCCGKALGGGMPLAAVVGRRNILDSWRSEGEARHTATFVAHPLACAAALAMLDIVHDENLVQRAVDLGEQIVGASKSLASLPGVVEIRGRGLLWGIEMHDAATAAEVSKLALEHGLILLSGGPEGRVLELLPPLTIAPSQLAAGLEILTRSILGASVEATPVIASTQETKP
jgi:4-aminobutyrate aminotransferase-like enzyme